MTTCCHLDNERFQLISPGDCSPLIIQSIKFSDRLNHFKNNQVRVINLSKGRRRSRPYIDRLFNKQIVIEPPAWKLIDSIGSNTYLEQHQAYNRPFSRQTQVVSPTLQSYQRDPSPAKMLHRLLVEG